jgi:hypothetical protein
MSIKISQLPTAAAVSDSAIYPLVEAGATQTASSVQLAYYMSGKIKTNITLSPGASGNFSVAHNLGGNPSAALIQMTSGGQIWFQIPSYDSTNLNLVASDASVTGNAIVFI